MKYRLICILLIVSVIFGCTKSEIKDSLKAHSRANQYTTATILSNNIKDKKFAKCVQNELEEDLPELKFISEDKFRDDLFPWFEPNTKPKDTKELSALLNKTMVRKRIDSLGVEILVYVHGDTHQDKMDGVVGGYSVVVGYGTAKRKTHIGTTVWDLRKKVHVGNTDVNFQGTIHMPILGIPIVIPAFTESSACSETAKRISYCLIGENSPKDEPYNRYK